MSNDIDNENENPEVSEPKDETFMPMESDSGSDDDEGPKIIARQDRIPLWSLSYIFIGILGMGYIFVFFDIFNINVSFTQTAMLLGLGSSPTDPKIASALAIAVLLNLIGYVIGDFSTYTTFRSIRKTRNAGNNFINYWYWINMQCICDRFHGFCILAIHYRNRNWSRSRHRECIYQ